MSLSSALLLGGRRCAARTLAAAVIAATVAACSDPPPLLRVDAPAALAPALAELVELVPTTGLEVTTGAGRGDATYHVEVIGDLTGCEECYRIDARAGDARGWVVHAADLLGAQYGVTHVLELLGYAEDLCYWRRELVMAENAVRRQSADVPSCFL